MKGAWSSRSSQSLPPMRNPRLTQPPSPRRDDHIGESLRTYSHG